MHWLQVRCKWRARTVNGNQYALAVYLTLWACDSRSPRCLSIWLLQIAHSTTFPTTRAAPALRVTALGLQQLLE